MVDNIKKLAISNTIWKFLERISAQIVSLVVSIILARLLSPSDYDVVSICSIFFAVAAMLITGGLNTALIQKKDATPEDYTGILAISLAISIFIYCILFIFAPTIANFYNRQILTKVFRVMGIILIINAYKSVLCAYISSKLEFRKFFFGTLIGTVTSAFVGIKMAFSGYGTWALVVQQMTNTIIDTMVLTCLTKMPLTKRFSIKKLKKLYQYGVKLFLTSVVQTIYSYLIPLYIGKKFTSSDISYYTKGRNFPDLILSSTTSTLSAVLFPILSKYQDDKKELLNGTRRFIQLSSYVLFPIMLGLFSISDSLVVVLLTEKWLPAAQYIRIFCVANMFDTIHVGNCETIKAIGRSDLYLRMELIKKSAYFVVIGIFLRFGETPVQLAEAFIVCTIIAFVVNVIPNTHLIGYSIKMQFDDIWQNLLLSIIMCVPVYLLNKITMVSFLKLCIQIVLGISIYVFFSVITKNKNFLMLRGYLLQLLKKEVNDNL